MLKFGAKENDNITLGMNSKRWTCHKSITSHTVQSACVSRQDEEGEITAKHVTQREKKKPDKIYFTEYLHETIRASQALREKNIRLGASKCLSASTGTETKTEKKTLKTVKWSGQQVICPVSSLLYKMFVFFLLPFVTDNMFVSVFWGDVDQW